MKIGFITPEYPHPKVKHAAGIGTSIKNLAVALAKGGHDIHVFVYAQEKAETFVEDGISFHLIPDRSYKIAKWYQYRKYIQHTVQAILTKEQIEIIEVPDWTGISAFMKFSIPVVMRFHGSDTYFCHIEGRKQKFKNKLFESLAVKSAQAYIAPTNYAGEVSKQLFQIKNKEIRTIHYGLALEQFVNDTPEAYETGLVLYIGTIIRKKGVLELPEIFKRVQQQYPTARLVLVGSDAPDLQTGQSSTWELLRSQLAPELKANVSYLGKVQYQKVQELIQKAHVCVFPTYAETLGMVTIESMAMQKPVVNSNIGWAQELMEDRKSGYLVHPSDHETYAGKIVNLLNNKELCRKMGAEAVRFVSAKFDIKKQVGKNIRFYTELINN